MRILNISALFFAVCSRVAIAEPGDLLLPSIEARLRAEAHDYKPSLVVQQSCTSTSTDSPFSAPDFAAKYPDGLFVICDAQVSNVKATATVLRYLFNASKGKPLVAKFVEVKLSKHGSAWRIETWHATAIDYAP